MNPRPILPLLVCLCAVTVLLVGCPPSIDYSYVGDRAATRPDLSGFGEEELVAKKTEARLGYISYLDALREFYVRRGHYDKLVSAETELAGLRKIRAYRATQYATPPGFNVADAGEVDLVEKVGQYRRDYRDCLEALDGLIRRQGSREQIIAVSRELDDLRQVRKYPYLLEADLPDPSLTRPMEKVPEADELFQDAMHYYNQRLPLWLSDLRKMKLALDKFNAIIYKYPHSDKIDDAFFYAAEILKEHFDENTQAVIYYKRAYEADPQTPHPARFQRAVVLDYRQHRRDEALKEYEAVLEHETGRGTFWSKSNSDFAATRIRQLKGQ